VERLNQFSTESHPKAITGGGYLLFRLMIPVAFVAEMMALQGLLAGIETSDVGLRFFGVEGLAEWALAVMAAAGLLAAGLFAGSSCARWRHGKVLLIAMVSLYLLSLMAAFAYLRFIEFSDSRADSYLGSAATVSLTLGIFLTTTIWSFVETDPIAERAQISRELKVSRRNVDDARSRVAIAEGRIAYLQNFLKGAREAAELRFGRMASAYLSGNIRGRSLALDSAPEELRKLSSGLLKQSLASERAHGNP
jgi:hypothetical protein